MDRLTAMAVFVEVAERGSLTAAAEVLDMSRAMVSRYLAEVEGWLGARLLHRTTRRVSLTGRARRRWRASGRCWRSAKNCRASWPVMIPSRTARCG